MASSFEKAEGLLELFWSIASETGLKVPPELQEFWDKLYILANEQEYPGRAIHISEPKEGWKYDGFAADLADMGFVGVENLDRTWAQIKVPQPGFENQPEPGWMAVVVDEGQIAAHAATASALIGVLREFDMRCGGPYVLSQMKIKSDMMNALRHDHNIEENTPVDQVVVGQFRELVENYENTLQRPELVM